MCSEYYFYIIKTEQMFDLEERSPHMKDNKSQLLELIDSLSDNQVLYVLTFLKKLFGSS